MNHTSPTRCAAVQPYFSSYLDGAVSGRRMQLIASHLDECATCSNEFAALREMQSSLAALGPVKAPADLSRKLRVAISHERARRSAGLFGGFHIKWQNAIRPILVQASAGFAGSVALLGSVIFLLGMVAVPGTVMANDEPIGNLTAPRYLYSAVVPSPIIDSHDSTIVVEAYVNSEGRVYDYRIVDGPRDEALQAQIKDQLLLSVFEPAKVFGSPIRGRAIITFSGISVQA